MKYVLGIVLLLIALPFIVKVVIMCYLIYKHYFINMANSKYPISFEMLYNILRNPNSQPQQREETERKPMGFAGTFFVEQAKNDKSEIIKDNSKKDKR